MTEIEDQLVDSHSRVLRGMGATAMRMLEVMQRRREEVARREADGQREAAQALRDREVAQRDAARTIAAQGLDPRWREAASDRELATAFVFAEAYRDSDPLARVAHEQMSQHLAARHGEVAAFIDAQVSPNDLEHIPAPEGAPSPTQQRWMDAARAEETVEAHGEQVARAAVSQDAGEQVARAGAPQGAVAEGLPAVLDADALRAQSDRTIASLLEDTSGDAHSLFIFNAPESKQGSVALDPETARRLADADATIADLIGDQPYKLVVVPDLTEHITSARGNALIAAASDETAQQWADLSQAYGREHADQWLEGNLSERDQDAADRWILWHDAQARIAQGESIQEAMQDLSEKESALGIDLDLNGTVGEADATHGRQLVQENEADLYRAGMGFGEFPHDRDSLEDLEQRDPEAASVLRTSMAGRTRGAADQVAIGQESRLPGGKKAQSRVAQRKGGRDLGR